MAKLVSKTYGEALYETAMEKGKTSELMGEITAVRGILNENPDFDKLMLHPGIPKLEKLKVVEEVFGGKVSSELSGFLRIIVENERYKELNSVFDYFTDKVKEANGVGVVFVTTAKELSESQKSQVKLKILQTTSYHTMEMHYEVDPSLIGGMVIRIGDRVVDSSIRTKLNDLTRQLLQIQLG
ncbi:MAG: ATP synthase F1 subunit delta [Lachnospiraceae bacterium]|nr:ATP synthase F1 subunit delta [Lachnospiraceae bacterium]